MPKDIRDKVTLSPDAYKVLEVEAMLHGDSLKDTASKLIIKAACPKCKEILDIMARPPKGQMEEVPKGERAQVSQVPISQEPEIIPAQEHKVTLAQGRKGPKSQLPDSPKAKRQRLSQDPMAITKIKELWKAGEHNAAKIAKEIGYPKATTWENIKKLKDKEELE